MIAKDRLQNLKRISERFGMPVSFYGFNVRDPCSTSMVAFTPAIDKDDASTYYFSYLPETFILKENDVSFDEKSIVINGLRIPESENHATYQYNGKIPTISWEKYYGVKFEIDGSKLKSMIRKSKECTFYIRFVSDAVSTRIEVRKSLTTDDCPILFSYDVGDGNDGIVVSSVIDSSMLDIYRTIIPKYKVSVRFGIDTPVVIDWEDSESNTYSVFIAPRIVDI